FRSVKERSAGRSDGVVWIDFTSTTNALSPRGDGNTPRRWLLPWPRDTRATRRDRALVRWHDCCSMRRTMKTISTKKLNLDLQTIRSLTGDTLSNVIGGQRQNIVSTDTPSACFACPKPFTKPNMPDIMCTTKFATRRD